MKDLNITSPTTTPTTKVEHPPKISQATTTQRATE